MGVPSNFSYLIRNHKDMLIKLFNFNKEINNLYFDSNSIIYDVPSFDSNTIKETNINQNPRKNYVGFLRLYNNYYMVVNKYHYVYVLIINL